MRPLFHLLWLGLLGTLLVGARANELLPLVAWMPIGFLWASQAAFQRWVEAPPWMSLGPCALVIACLGYPLVAFQFVTAVLFLVHALALVAYARRLGRTCGPSIRAQARTHP